MTSLWRILTTDDVLLAGQGAPAAPAGEDMDGGSLECIHMGTMVDGKLVVRTAKKIGVRMMLGLVMMAAVRAQSETVYYTLDNLVLADHTLMTGAFSWTFDAGDFENGVGQFTSLSIPHTSHDQNDLTATFDVGRSIEITLAGSVHDDGVDISLVLLQPLTPAIDSRIDLVESKYEIGGNGFHDGSFLSGRISPARSILSIVPASPGFVTLSWEPGGSGPVLQETPGLSPANWMDSSSGSTNPVVVPIAAPKKFYRLSGP